MPLKPNAVYSKKIEERLKDSLIGQITAHEALHISSMVSINAPHSVRGHRRDDPPDIQAESIKSRQGARE